MFTKVALIALAAGAQVSFAAPVQQEERSLKAVGTAIAGGLAAGAAGAIAKDVLGSRSLSAIENFFKNLKRDEPSGVLVDTESGIIYMDLPDANEGRSLKAVGTAIAGGLAAGAAGAIAKDVLGSRSLSAIENFFKNLKRDVSSGLLVDTETGVLYMDVPDANEGRSLKAVGTAIAGGLAAGAAGAIAKDVLGSRSLSAIENFFKNLKRDESSGLMVDTETGVIYMDVPDEVEGRSLKAVGTAIAGGLAAGAAGAIAKDVLGSRSLSAIENFFKNLKRDEPEARSISAIENFFKNLKRDEPSGLLVDTETGVLYMDVPDAVEGRSLKAVGTAIAGGLAAGAAGAIAKDVLGSRSLSAIENFFKNLKRDEPEARSISAIENFFKNLKRDELMESMSKRAIDDLE